VGDGGHRNLEGMLVVDQRRQSERIYRAINHNDLDQLDDLFADGSITPRATPASNPSSSS
jgi:hypothetical protein